MSVPSWYFYTLKNDCHSKSSYHLSPYKIITIFIDYKIVIILFIDSCCIFYPSDICFKTGSLYFFNSLTCFTHPLHPLPLMITSFFLYLWIYLFCYVCSFILIFMCSLIDEWIKKMWFIYIFIYIYIYTQTHIYIHTMEYYSSIKKNETLLFATTCMNLEHVTLSE